jgi:hypothetical protein
VIRAAVAAVVAIGLAGLAAAPAHAAPAAIAAVVGPDGAADVRTSTLIGPSGQVYAGDGAGRWVRTVPGGIAADVRGATRIGADLLVTGISTPMYRFDGKTWTATRVGQSGKTFLGRGPVPAVAIGKHVFVERKGKWARVGQAPGAVTAVWASAKRVFVVTAAGVHVLRGSTFVRTRAPVSAIVGTTAAWGIADDGVFDLATGRAVSTAVGVIAATAGDAAPWLVVSAGTAPPRLVGKVGTTAVAVDTPLAAGTALAGIAADRAGNVALVTAAGEVHLRIGDTWSTGALADELPPAKPGAGPAQTR